jgi:hypothetical protein
LIVVLQYLSIGIVDFQEIEKIWENYEIESIEKSYFFNKNGEILT